MSQTTTVISVILGLLLALALFRMVHNFRRARSAPYFILRRAAASRGWRWFFTSSGISIALILLVIIRPTLRLPSFIAANTAANPEVAPLPVEPDTATATPDASPVSVAATQAPDAPQATQAQIVSSAASDATLVPTRTPAPLFATRESDVTPSRSASLTITDVSTAIDDSFLPVNPGATLGAGATRLYVFFDFEGMTDGVSWSGLILENGQVFEDTSFDQLWSLGEAGVGWWRFFDRASGWPAASYEIQFYIGDTLADSISFQLADGIEASDQPASAATP